MTLTNLQKRILSALILAPLAIWILIVGGIPYTITIIVLTAIMLFEWHNMVKNQEKRALWYLLGIIYIIPGCLLFLSLRMLRVDQEIGILILLLILIVAWFTDIGAYFIGKKFGKKKLAPKISPNKTWAGARGGLIFGALAFTILLTVFLSGGRVSIGGDGMIFCFILGAILSAIGQLGDLFESWVKRKCGVKDSGNIIPGHGGLLDRLDSVLMISSFLGFFIVPIILLEKF